MAEATGGSTNGQDDDPALFDAIAARIRPVERAGDWTRAAAEWAALRARFPGRWEGACGEARALMELHRFDEADTILSETVAQFPGEPGPLCDWANLTLYTRNWPQAFARWSTVRSRFPDLLEGVRGMGAALRDAGRFDAADAELENGMRRFPDDFWLAYAHARVAQQRGDWPEAARRWHAVSIAFPDMPAGYTGEAQALRRLDRRREAFDVLRRARALFPDETAIARELESYGDLTDVAGGSAAPVLVGLTAPVDFNDPSVGAMGAVISRDPVIIQSATYSFADVVVPTMTYYRQTGRHVTFLFNSLMSLEFEINLRRKLMRELVELRTAFPDAAMIFLVNDVGELTVARSLGFPAELINNNAFVDERLFDIDSAAVKRFDAVYNARFHPYKRHFLATEVPSLVLLAADPTAEHHAGLTALLPQAHLITAHVDSARVAEIVNTARCGLILSGSEGANYATMEYLLCGVPVVTTRNIGGRNWWLSDDVAVYAEDTPRSVAAAVAETIRRDVHGPSVREHTLQKLHRERLVFFALVDRVFAAHGQPGRRYEADFMTHFSDKYNYQWGPVRRLCVPPP
jgi:glycosyltransferase involved in cell wall biosynthesis